jgi:transglutaminase-like putative cysteine protease
MRNRVNIALRVSTAGLVMSGYLALASVREYGAAALLVPAVLLIAGPAGQWCDRRYAGYRKLVRAGLIAYLCFIPLTVLSLGLLDAVMALVIVLQGCLLAQRKTVKEYYYVYLMAFFLLLAACVQSPEPVIGLVMLVFLLSAIWAFITIRLYAEQQRVPAREPVLSRLEAATPEATLPDYNGFDAGLVLSVSVVSLLAVALTVALFFVTPRMEAGFLGRGEGEIERSGLTQTVELRGGATIEDDPTAVMRVEFPDYPNGRYPVNLTLYWRCTTLPWYFASQWTRKGLRDHLEPNVPPLLVRPALALTRRYPLQESRPRWEGSRLVRQNIYVDDAPEEGLPCLDLVRDVRISGPSRDTTVTWDQANDFTVVLSTRGPRRLVYEVLSEVGDPPPGELEQASSDYESAMGGREYSLLTNHELRPETQELARRVTEGQRTAYGQAQAIERWLSGPEFQYTTIVPPLPARSAIDAFVTQTKRGHCELFASAMALMLRSLGVPTRVVVGFRGGEWNESDQSYTVRANMAHLWVEAYFVGYGWVAFDPSPRADETVDAAMDRFRRAFSRYGLKAKMMWYELVVGFDRREQFLRLRNISVGMVRALWNPELPEASTVLREVRFLRPALIVLFLAGLAGAVLWSLGMGRAPRGPRLVLSEDQARARALYRRLRCRLRRLGTDIRGKTADELAGDSGGLTPEAAVVVAEVVRAYNAARFGMRPLSREQAAALRRGLRRLRRGTS